MLLPHRCCCPSVRPQQPLPTARRVCAAGFGEVPYRRRGSAVAVRAAATGNGGAAGGRRGLLFAGCACCGSLLLPGLQRAAQAGGDFSYGEEAGPLAWGGTCASGTRQSPINLPRRGAAAAAKGGPCAGAPVFQYSSDSRVTVKNTGTTIQVNFEPGTNSASWGGAQLELLQFHFHTPSEHAFGGQRAAMEAHLVHRDSATGGLAVVGVLLQPPEGGAPAAPPNPCLEAALAHVPSRPKAEAASPVPIDPSALLPPADGAAPRPFFHYAGSLTTPPCSERVDWVVMEQPLAVAERQVLEFMRFAGGGTTYGHNARPLQPLNGRPLDFSCLGA